MRHAPVLALMFSFSACSTSHQSAAPIASGTYQFQHKDAEFPNSPGFPVTVKIDGRRVVVTNQQAGRSIPVGVIEAATLIWHPSSGQWILGSGEGDAKAPSVGGCGDNDPHIINFTKREIWTCEGGP